MQCSCGYRMYFIGTTRKEKLIRPPEGYELFDSVASPTWMAVNYEVWRCRECGARREFSCELNGSEPKPSKQANE